MSAPRFRPRARGRARLRGPARSARRRARAAHAPARHRACSRAAAARAANSACRLSTRRSWAVGVTVGRLRQRDQLIDLFDEFGSESRHVGDARVMRQVHRLGLAGGHARSRPSSPGLELHRRRGREDECAARGVEFPVRDAEGVAGEEGAGAVVAVADVMAAWPGVSNTVSRRLPSTSSRPRWPRRCARAAPVSACRRCAHHVLAVDGRGAGHQRRRIDHVAHAARMHDQLRVRQPAYAARRCRRRGRGGRASAATSRPRWRA